MRTPSEALDVLRALPCGARLLDADTEGAWLVGGAVRDLLLGTTPRELDVVVEGDPAPLVAALGDVVADHGRFGVTTVEAGHCRFDVVRARAESYAAPGALPDVRPGTLEEDLARRDFTVNALALGLRGEGLRGDGLEDLRRGVLRVLHPGSFRDDPTRLWRMVRYAVRLGFAPEPGTQRWATEAVRAGALGTVSGDRLGAELRLALCEPDPLAVLHAAQLQSLVSGLRLDPGLVQEAMELRTVDAREDLLLLGAVLPDGGWARGWGFTAAEERVLARCAELEPIAPGRPSEVVARLRGEPDEAVAVAGARGHAETAWRFLHEWREVRLEIDGRDLLEAGVPEGPELGERLARTLARRLDGELPPGRAAELAAALA